MDKTKYLLGHPIRTLSRIPRWIRTTSPRFTLWLVRENFVLWLDILRGEQWTTH